MNEDENKEIVIFLLDAIEKMSSVILKEYFDVEEIQKINYEAKCHLNSLK
jgi:hypothetical protein